MGELGRRDGKVENFIKVTQVNDRWLKLKAMFKN